MIRSTDSTQTGRWPDTSLTVNRPFREVVIIIIRSCLSKLQRVDCTCSQGCCVYSSVSTLFASCTHSIMSEAPPPAAADQTERTRRPNILITGTPGVGKTATASLVAERLGFQHLCVGDVVKQNKFYEGKDEKFDSMILDEDRLLDHMEQMLADAADEERGVVVDYHGCDFFPERWFDLVLVLRAKTDVLYDRLVERGYSETKRSENMECEIMQIVLDEARASYAEEIVHEVQSNTLEDMEGNVTRVEQWVQQWIKDNS